MKNIIMNQIRFIAATAAIGLTACLATASALAAPVKNIVLVHGAWADGSGWKGVYDILVKDGYNVSIVQEPETSFQEDVAATKRVLEQQKGPCISDSVTVYWRSRHYRSGDGCICRRFGLHRCPHARCRRE